MSGTCSQLTPASSAQAVPRAAKSESTRTIAMSSVLSVRAIFIPTPLARDLYGLERLLVDVPVTVYGRLAARGAAAFLDDDLDERFDHDRVELRAGVRAKLAERLLGTERDAIGPLARHRVVGVGYRDDLRGERDLAAFEPRGVAGSIEVLVVREHDRTDAIEHRHVAEKARADRRVGPHLDPLLVGELVRLGKDRLGNPDLADVVEERAEFYPGDLVGTEPELPPDLDGVVHRRRGVSREVRLLGLEGPDERADNRDMRLLETIVGLAQQLVDRAELLIPLSNFGGLRHVETEGEPCDAQRDREDEHTEEAQRLVRECERGALHRRGAEVHRHPAVVRPPYRDNVLAFRRRDRDRGESGVHEEVRAGRQSHRQERRPDRGRWSHAANEPVELPGGECRERERPEVECRFA